MKLTICYSPEDGSYEVDLPDNTKHFHFNPSNKDVSIEFYDQNSQKVNKAVVEDTVKDDSDITVMEIIQDADASVFAAAAYIDKNPIKTAYKIAEAKRNSSSWYRLRKIANKYSCAYDLKDTDACDNSHLAALLDYYVQDKDTIEKLLSIMGSKYGTTSRSHRLNYAAYETLKQVRSNGNGAFYTKEDLLKPKEDRLFITYQVANMVTMHPYHNKKHKWFSSLCQYFFSKCVYELIEDEQIEYLNDFPKNLYELVKPLLDKYIQIEKDVNKDFKVPPQGLFQTVIDNYFPKVERTLQALFPNIKVDYSVLSYKDFIEQPPSLRNALKYKLASTNYARKDSIYSMLWSKFKVHSGVRTYHITDRTN